MQYGLTFFLILPGQRDEESSNVKRPLSTCLLPLCENTEANISLENEYDLHKNELIGETHVHNDSLVRGLVFTQSQKAYFLVCSWTVIAYKLKLLP